jgi:hypothetical protein
MLKSALSLLVCSVLAATLQGCATNASQAAMSVNAGELAVKPSAKLTSAISVRSVTGGKETNPLWTSEVDNSGFKNALIQSINVAGYGSSSEKAKYFIDAELQKLDKPLIGLTFDVTSTVNYRVSGDGFQKEFPITATGTATFSDAWAGLERLRIANEKSIKENIKLFLVELSKVIN